MNESGQVYNYNKLRTIRTLTDIISQCIVAFAFSAFVILGLTNKSDSYIIATLLMAVPVIITYAARKNIHKNFLFMLIHAALLLLMNHIQSCHLQQRNLPALQQKQNQSLMIQMYDSSSHLSSAEADTGMR